jgi:hypothetical protein
MIPKKKLTKVICILTSKILSLHLNLEQRTGKRTVRREVWHLFQDNLQLF